MSNEMDSNFVRSYYSSWVGLSDKEFIEKFIKEELEDEPDPNNEVVVYLPKSFYMRLINLANKSV